jgi:hypothetical protein
MKTIKHLMASIALLAVIVMPVLFMPNMASAVDANAYYGTGNVGTAGMLGNQSPVDMTISIIKIALGFLGLIAVIIILIGGFKWMTAGGSEDKIGEAKKMIIQGIIGLVIVLAAWGIATYVINTAFNVTNG